MKLKTTTKLCHCHTKTARDAWQLLKLPNYSQYYLQSASAIAINTLKEKAANILKKPPLSGFAYFSTLDLEWLKQAWEQNRIWIQKRKSPVNIELLRSFYQGCRFQLHSTLELLGCHSPGDLHTVFMPLREFQYLKKQRCFHNNHICL